MLATLGLALTLSAQVPVPPPADTIGLRAGSLSLEAPALLPSADPAGALRPSVSGVALLTPMTLETSPVADGEPQLVEYSDAYFTRLTIHRWASYLTLPLFVSQYVVGRKLMNGEGSENLRGVHGALAGGVAALFAVNTITGGLNFLESRHDPEGRTRRTIHSVLMLLADAGFVATGALASEREDEYGFASGPANNNAHRNMALASMGTALLSYAIMLPIFGRD